MKRLFLISIGLVMNLGFACSSTRQASDMKLIPEQTVKTGYSTFKKLY
jgi:hypothetical protein